VKSTTELCIICRLISTQQIFAVIAIVLYRFPVAKSFLNPCVLHVVGIQILSSL